ncbi:MAG: T9SS type A sorting domain-containing protein [Bacteroidia bacterium]
MKSFFSLSILIFLWSLSFGQQNALEFDGTNDYVQTTAIPPTGNAPRTIECWIKSKFKSTQHVLVDYGSMTPNGSRFTLNMINGRLRIELGGNGVTGTRFIADTSWHHVAVTYDNSASPNFRTFIDGKIEDSFNISGITVNTRNTTQMRFGVRVDGSNFYKGTMDEVRVWNYARNHYQIKNNYQKELCEQEKGLVAYHKFNQGIAGKNNRNVDESEDLSVKDKDGDLKGFALTGTASNWVVGKSLTACSVSSTATVSGCGRFKTASGKIYTQSGTYLDTTKSYMGCDSFITYSVTIIPNPTQTIYDTTCKVYVSPSGKYAWNKSGTYTDQLVNPNGCDTIVTIHLIVSNRSKTNNSITNCGPFASPSGKYTWTASGTYFDTLSSQYGCDSIITTTFTQLQSDTTLQVIACNSYTSPSGKYTYTSSGVYTDTLPNANNCDSIITIELTLGNTSYSSINEFACKKYTSPSGKYEFTSSGFYYDTIQNYSGCDSVISIQLEIGARSSTISEFACDKYIAPSGATYTESGQYTDIIKTKKGCDSTITIKLIVMKTAYASTTLSGCNKVTSPSGRHVYTVSGTYSDTIFRQTKCDSVISVEVTIDELPEVSVVRSNNQEIASSETGDTYQWLWCEGYVKIDGATNMSYKPETEEMYAVEVTKGQCIDTSECYVFVGKDDLMYSNIYQLYPNPAYDKVIIDTKNSTEIKDINLYDIHGRLVREITSNSPITELNISDLQKGVYIVEIKIEQLIFRESLIIE